MRLRLAVALSLIAVLVMPVTVLAVYPLALPGQELVMFNADEVQMLGFAGGDVQVSDEVEQ